MKPLSLDDYHKLFRVVGATLVRRNAHEQWRLPNGRMFTLPFSKGGWQSPNDVHCRWRDICRVMPELRATWEAMR